MRSSVPATPEGSAPEVHSSLKRRKAGGACRRREAWGFPSPGERGSSGLPPHPRPKCQVSPGEGRSRGLPSPSGPRLRSQLSLHRGPRPRACTHSCTLTSGTFTHSLVQTHTLSDVLPERAETALRDARTPAFRRAGHAGRGCPGSAEIDNRFRGLLRISFDAEEATQTDPTLGPATSGKPLDTELGPKWDGAVGFRDIVS